MENNRNNGKNEIKNEDEIKTKIECPHDLDELWKECRGMEINIHISISKKQRAIRKRMRRLRNETEHLEIQNKIQ